MPISLPIRQVCGESYLPNTKIYLSRTTGWDFFRALRHHQQKLRMLSQSALWVIVRYFLTLTD